MKQWSCSSCTVMVMERDECVYTLSAQLDKNGYHWGKWRAGRLFSFKFPTGGTTLRFLLRLKILLIGLIWEIQFKCREAYFREVNSVFKRTILPFPCFFQQRTCQSPQILIAVAGLSPFPGFNNQVPLKASNVGCTACVRRPVWQPVGRTLTGNDRRRWPLGDGSDIGWRVNQPKR